LEQSSHPQALKKAIFKAANHLTLRWDSGKQDRGCQSEGDDAGGGGGDLASEVLWAAVDEASVPLGIPVGGLAVAEGADVCRIEVGDEVLRAPGFLVAIRASMRRWSLGKQANRCKVVCKQTVV